MNPSDLGVSVDLSSDDPATTDVSGLSDPSDSMSLQGVSSSLLQLGTSVGVISAAPNAGGTIAPGTYGGNTGGSGGANPPTFSTTTWVWVIGALTLAAVGFVAYRTIK